MYAPTDILIFSHDVVLLESRRRVLEREGFHVSAANEQEDAERIASTRKIDILLLCQTLAQDECDEVLIAARRHRPEIKHLYLATQSTLEPDRRDRGTNFFLSPVALVALVQGAV